MEEAAGLYAEIAAVGVLLKAEEVILLSLGAGGCVDEDVHACGQDQRRLVTIEMTIHVLFYEAVGGGVLEPAAGLELDALGLEREPLAGLLVLVIDADLVDARGERRGGDLFLGVEDKAGATGLHGGDDLLRDAGVLKRDEVVRCCVVTARLRLDGLNDDGVVESGLAHLDDGGVVEEVRLGDVVGGLERAVIRGGTGLCERALSAEREEKTEQNCDSSVQAEGPGRRDRLRHAQNAITVGRRCRRSEERR